MLKIKLARFGKRNQPHYRVVVTEQRSKRDGQYLEAIGTYAPTTPGKPLEIDADKYQAWLKKGAQPTTTVARLFAKSQGHKSPTVKKESTAEKKETVVEKKEVVEKEEVVAEKKKVASTKPKAEKKAIAKSKS